MLAASASQTDSLIAQLLSGFTQDCSGPRFNSYLGQFLVSTPQALAQF